MPSVREEITKTLQRLSRRARLRPETDSPSPPIRKPPAIQAGTEFGSYKIVRRLGAGGMGHVYLATDSRLGRNVALKFLSPDLVSDSDMLRRLKAEARTASALNHPNILTIYEIGECDGEHLIASEYVDGQTLRSALNRKEVDTQTAIDIICQVLSALTAAHAAGIVHRDLKPGNIMIRSDGYVKVIDFGLAKRTGKSPAHETDWDKSLTRPGAVVGTVFYMSPEQACGDKIDHRTDIWSLGVILFEIFTKRRPFEGDSDHRVIVNICSKPVPAIPNSGALPSGLIPVIERALEKDPADRYQSAREMLSDLSTVGLNSTSGTVTRTVLLRPAERRARLPIIAAAIVFLLIGGWLAFRLFHRGPDWFQIDKVRQLTFTGRVLSAAISPDGKYLAYVNGDPDGMQTVFLMQVNGASEEVKIPAKNTKYLGLTFAPDDQLFAVAKNRDDQMGRLYEVPVVGNARPRPIITDIDGPVTFSPTGEKMAFVRNTPGTGPDHNRTLGAILVADRARPAVAKPLFSTTESGISRYLAWSQGDDRIAAILFNYFGERSGHTVLDMLDMNGRETRRDLPAWQLVGSLAFRSSGRSLITTAADYRESAVHAQLREINAETGQIYDLTREIAGYSNASLSNDGLQLAVVKGTAKATLWISDANNYSSGLSSWAEPDRFPNLSWLDSGKLVVGSLRGGYPNLWLFDIQEQTRTGLTREDSAEQDAAAIPGTQSVVFTSQRSGQTKLWRYDAEPNSYSQLTFGPNRDDSPSVSPDGKWVVYTSWSSTTPYLYRVSTLGGTSQRVSSFSATMPAYSPDGKRLACRLQDPKSLKWHVALLKVDEPKDVRYVPNVGLPFVWSPDGTELSSVITDRHGTSNVWNVSLSGGVPHKITAFEDQTILKFAWSPGGDRLACLRSNSASDVVLFTRKPGS